MAKFEEKLKKLETIVEKLSSPDLPLDESLKLFEEGVNLVKELNEELNRAKGRVVEFQKYLEEIGDEDVEKSDEEELPDDQNVPF